MVVCRAAGGTQSPNCSLEEWELLQENGSIPENLRIDFVNVMLCFSPCFHNIPQRGFMAGGDPVCGVRALEGHQQ